MQDFKREFGRYIVIKWEDVGCLSVDEQKQLIDFSRRVVSANFSRTGRPWECLVLESHWPEYERAWGMLEARVTEKNEDCRSDQTVEHTSLDTGKVDQVTIYGTQIKDMYPGTDLRVIRSSDEPSGGCDGSGCKPTEEERRQLREGDFCAEELWGANRPTCPNCISLTEYPLPDWAIATGDGSLQLGLHLATKDGRRCGNAHIVGMENSPGGVIYTALTDAGNRLRLLESEIDEMFYRGGYLSALDDILAKFDRDQPATPTVLARPSGHGPLAWFLASVDHAREQGHENMMLERGLGNLIAEHIRQLESQVEKYQRIASTTAVHIDLSGVTDAERAALMAQGDLYRNQRGVISPAPRPAPRTGDAKKSLPLGAVGTNYHMVSAVWRDDGEWIEITIAPLASDVHGRARQAGRLSVILAKQHPGVEVVISLLGEKQVAMRGLIVKQIMLTSDTVEVKHAANDWSRIVVVEVPPKEGE